MFGPELNALASEVLDVLKSWANTQGGIKKIQFSGTVETMNSLMSLNLDHVGGEIVIRIVKTGKQEGGE